MLPLRDRNPTTRTPVITVLLIIANVAVFLLVQRAGTLGSTEDTQFTYEHAAVPCEITQGHPLTVTELRDDACDNAHQGRELFPDKNVALSALVSMFLHGGWLHLGGNMLFLWVFGNNVEDRLGRLRYLVFYLLCGYLAAYGFALVNANATDPLIGASGAIAGVLGAYLMFFPRARVWSLVPFLLFIPLRLPAWLVLGLWFVLQWAYSAGYAVSAAGSVAYVAHVVGFVFGFLAAVPFLRRRPPYPYQGYPRRPWS